MRFIFVYSCVFHGKLITATRYLRQRLTHTGGVLLFSIFDICIALYFSCLYYPHFIKFSMFDVLICYLSACFVTIHGVVTKYVVYSIMCYISYRVLPWRVPSLLVRGVTCTAAMPLQTCRDTRVSSLVVGGVTCTAAMPLQTYRDTRVSSRVVGGVTCTSAMPLPTCQDSHCHRVHIFHD